MIKLEGLAEMSKALEQASFDTVIRVEKVVAQTALNVRGRAVTRIQQGPASGHIYRSSVTNKDHQASAPGEAPASDSGMLAGSITVELDGVTAYVGTNLDYGYWLEFGTTKMEPRPFLMPSLEEEASAFRAKLKEAIR